MVVDRNSACKRTLNPAARGIGFVSDLPRTLPALVQFCTPVASLLALPAYHLRIIQYSSWLGFRTTSALLSPQNPAHSFRCCGLRTDDLTHFLLLKRPGCAASYEQRLFLTPTTSIPRRPRCGHCDEQLRLKARMALALVQVVLGGW